MPYGVKTKTEKNPVLFESFKKTPAASKFYVEYDLTTSLRPKS